MSDVWPSIDPVLITSLQQLFKTPLQLQAAFDSEEDCYTLLTGHFPDLIDEDVRNASAEMIRWQSVSAPAFKLSLIHI